MDTRQDWYTPISGWNSTGFISFNAGLASPLVVTVQNEKQDGESYQFEWNDYCAFQTILDGLRYPWKLTASDMCKSSPTHIIAESSWIAQIENQSGLLNHHYPNCKHYAIYTTSFWIEVIAEGEPKITKVNV